MKTMTLGPASPASTNPTRQAFGELKTSAHRWLEQLADILAGCEMLTGPVVDEGADEVVHLELTLQSANVVTAIGVLLEVRPNAERDLTEFVLMFRARRLLGGMAWVDVSLPPELAMMARTLKGGKSVTLVAQQLIEQLESVSSTDYLVYFEDMMQ